jgi:membrane protein
VATALWLLISLGFRFYVMHFGQYNKMYGAIGAVIVLLVWFYLSGLVMLFGAELNSEIEHASPFGKKEGEKVPGEHRRWLFRARRHGGIGETAQLE